MPSITALAFAALILLYFANVWYRLSKNLRAAKASGIPYVISPIHGIDRFWLVTEQLWMPLLKRLPTNWTGSWIDIIAGDWVWHDRFTTYKKLGSDTFIVVSPVGNIINTADANVINQITTRRNDFPKPTEMYGILDFYGKNVVTHEGSEWRRHRKITSPPFTEKNNHLVWTESLFQAQNMLTSWVGKDGKGGHVIPGVSKDCMRLSLHVISRAGFDVRCLWPGVNDDDEEAIRQGAMSTSMVPKGHSMSYVESMATLLHRIPIVLLFPGAIAKRFPSDYVRKAYQSYEEWGKYMREMYTRKRQEILATGKDVESGLDLMGAMIKGSGLIPGTPNSGKPDSGLSESEIMGNAFVFMLAGHETAANTIHYSIIFLALRIASQRHLQEDLDNVFSDAPIADWDYDRYLPQLFGDMAGAIMNETLRLIPPVVNIPKSVTADHDQPLTVNGKECIAPKGAYIALGAVGVHRNPKYWPHGPPSDPERPVHPTSNRDNDLEEFRPERWLLESKPNSRPNTRPSTPRPSTPRPNGSATKEATPETDLGVNTAPDTARTLFAPPRGAYIPFSEGYRACLGRRFAQVEILATLAVIFRHYSVELAVDEWASDEEVERWRQEGEEGRRKLRAVWEKARDRVEEMMRTEMGTIITIQFRKRMVPLRFVRRGEERFNFV